MDVRLGRIFLIDKQYEGIHGDAIQINSSNLCHRLRFFVAAGYENQGEKHYENVLVHICIYCGAKLKN